VTKVQLSSRWFILFSLVILLMTGCSPSDGDDQGRLSQDRTQTAAASSVTQGVDVETPGGVTEVPQPDENEIQTEQTPGADDAAPTLTPAATQEKPMVSVNANTKCRNGPSTAFESVFVLERGEQAEVVGHSADWQYWIIKIPDGSGECWLWAYYATVRGPRDGLVVFTPPPLPSVTPTPTITPTATPTPTPTPAFDWSGIWTIATGPIDGEDLKEFVMTVAVSGETFTGSVDYMGNLVMYNGKIRDDDLMVYGTWSDAARGGLFRFYAQGANQFQGFSAFGSDRSALCGARRGAGFPTPCYRE